MIKEKERKIIKKERKKEETKKEEQNKNTVQNLIHKPSKSHNSGRHKKMKKWRLKEQKIEIECR